MCTNCKGAKVIGVLNDCSVVSAGDFELYLSRFTCIRDNNLYSIIGKSEDYINDRIILLTAALTDKLADPTSCRYYSVIGQIAQDISTILTNTNC